ncbi:MAG: CHAT domain-containing protein [Xenococcus sp. MO_188.B8]|nr:CHAT domain-containing protein [Xenococcus sp. MO_188.B8]
MKNKNRENKSQAKKYHLYFWHKFLNDGDRSLAKVSKIIKSQLYYWLSSKKRWKSLLLLALFTTIACTLTSPVRGIDTYSSRGELPQQDIFHSQENAIADLLEQGRIAYQAGRYQEAVNILQQALTEEQTQADNLQQAMILSNLALAYQKLGKWTEVSNSLEASLKVLEKLDNSRDRALILAQTIDIQGRLQLVRGQAESALETWSQAAAIYEKAGRENGVLRSRINQAQALQTLGFYRRAVRTLTKLEQTLQERPDSLTKAVGLRSLGNALQLVGNLEQSQQTLKTSLAIAQELKSPPDISAALFSLGNVARSQKQLEKAINYYQQAVSTAISPTQQIKAQLNQLSLLIKTEAWSDIPALLFDIESQLEELPLSRPAVYARINFAQNLIKLWSRETENDSPLPHSLLAIAYFPKIEPILTTTVQQAQKLGDKRAEAYALGSLGRLFELKQQWSQAQKLTQQALIIAQAVNARDITYQWQWQLGRLLQVQGHYQEATAAYKQAVNTLQSLRSDLVTSNPEIQFTFRESVEPIYREYVGLLLQSQETTQPSEPNLAAAREAIDSLQLAELENFFHATCLDAEPVLIDQVTDQDDPTAAVIYTIALPDRFEIILKLPQQKLRHYTTPIDNPKKVERIIQRLAQSLTQRNSQETLPLAQQVYDWLIRPTAEDLATSNVKTLVFILDSSLRNVPMSVLHDGQQYLVEKYGIAITPGLQLIEPQPIAQQQLRVLTAGLTEARSGFPPLRYVADELNTVQSQISETETLVDRDFTSTAFQTKINQLPFRVVHLATHGQFSSQAENTFILTWDDRINVNQLNDLLRSSDIGNEEAIELLVLSACETLTGDKRAALGLAGVAVRAGARSTLATLWRVNDEATSLLMGGFYQGLSDRNKIVTKAEALRQAQLTLLKSDRFKRPHFWASYVLVGNWL